MRWAEVLEHKELNDLPFKVELNEWGNIVMSPASNKHGFIQAMLVLLLNQQKQKGVTLTECSIETAKGVKVADVIWGRNDFFSKNKLETPYPIAPEICIEIWSPSNTAEEMSEKKHLYLEKGAKEVWLCKESGEIIFFDSVGEIACSNLFKTFPKELNLDLPA